MDAVPISVALVAGALAAFNPCGFPVLVAFLASSLDGADRPEAPTRRLAHGVGAGLLVAAGFVGTFMVIGLPLGYGLSGIADAVPWVGLLFGLVLVAVGTAVLAGRHVALRVPVSVPGLARRAGTTQALFGAGYAVASLGCTLPVFLSLLGAASASSRFTTTVAVFSAYGLGLALVLIALATGAALARDGIGRWAGRLLPYVGRLTGALLVVAGGYLSYYWLRTGFGAPSEAASDPLIGAVSGFAAWIEVQAQKPWALPFVLVLGAVLVLAGLAAFRGSRRVVVGAVALLVVGGLVGFEVGAGGSQASSPRVPEKWILTPGPNDRGAPVATEADRRVLRATGRAPGLIDLSDLGELRGLFDARDGETRVVALLSPTCLVCLQGAAWLQGQLAKHPDADIMVLAVWFPLLSTDERIEWDDRILTDPRVHHLWDEDQVVGRWYSDLGYGDLPVQWDAAFIYPPESTWGHNEEPSDLVAWGRPIIAHDDTFEEHLDSLLRD